ncbi:MAG: helix-turn-helix domain-containing protein [Clostridia bacterium]
MAGQKESGYLVLSIDQPEQLCRVARAFSSPKRLEILQLLGTNNIMNVNEIAKAIHLPISSAAMHICTLEEAGLITCAKQPSFRGTMKMCTREKNEIVFQLNEAGATMQRIAMQQLPIGAYSMANGIAPSCGLASHNAPIGVYNNPRSFHLPERLNAEILWFRNGYLEYQFSMLSMEEIDVHWLEISFEACSQAPSEMAVWQSDVRVSINGHLLGTHTCTCDSQERRGTFNPAWWPNVATQHGELLTWRVDADGSSLQKERVGDTCLQDLALTEQDMIAVRIEAPSVQDRQLGINVFGNHFGDYNQGIGLQVGYCLK